MGKKLLGILLLLLKDIIMADFKETLLDVMNGLKKVGGIPCSIILAATGLRLF